MPTSSSSSLSSTTSATRSKRRPSYLNLSSSQQNDIVSDVLSPRTPRSISKSRRSSVVAEHVQEVIENSTSSRRGSVASSNNIIAAVAGSGGPPLLSDSTNSYFQDLSSQDDEAIRSETPTLKARTASSEDLRNRFSSTAASASGDSSTSNRRTRSSSISSLLGSTHVLPSFDVHTLYKIKTTRSSRKLDRFFGEYAPHDICIKEIRKEGLKAILESKAPLCYFLYHLLEEYSSENLFFFIELEQYESFSYASLGQQLATAQHIFNTYLTRNSYFEVNLDDKVRRTVTQSLEKKNAKTCFEFAKRAVYSLLESSYMRFQNTDTFQDMVKQCGELTAHYNDEARAAAVNKLLAYVEQQHLKIYANDNPTAVFQSTTIRRHELIKSMIHEFCRTLVGVEFNYYTPDTSSSSIHEETSDTTASGASKFRHVGFPSFGNGPSANKKR
ncbi:uncharacterized protein ATC70_010997 [Mucor velutinosus]|uniref:RGS domain-containing protein n=1 Tax=Mucor velutinosus TaxID=708070 RepID=A0AAN7I0Q4_9FUNG|nr:hypothetical protein ATC70_010997 [Mucor velutinosus]